MIPSVLPFVLVVLAALAAVGVFVLGRGRSDAAPERITGKEALSMLSLMEAATAAYEAAKREGMTIAWVAENAQDAAGPVDWLLRSIVGVVPAYRKSGAAFEKTTGVGTELQSLYIRKRDFQTYLDWARGMQ